MFNCSLFFQAYKQYTKIIFMYSKCNTCVVAVYDYDVYVWLTYSVLTTVHCGTSVIIMINI